MRFIRALLGGPRSGPRITHSRLGRMAWATIRCTRNEKEPKGVALDCGDPSGQQTGRDAQKRSVGACVTVAWAGSGVRVCFPSELEISARVAQASAVCRRAARRGSAASQALGLDSRRAWRRGSGVRVDIRLVSLDASRSVRCCSGKPFEWVRSCCSAACVASCIVTWGRRPPVCTDVASPVDRTNGPVRHQPPSWVRRQP